MIFNDDDLCSRLRNRTFPWTPPRIKICGQGPFAVEQPLKMDGTQNANCQSESSKGSNNFSATKWECEKLEGPVHLSHWQFNSRRTVQDFVWPLSSWYSLERWKAWKRVGNCDGATVPPYIMVCAKHHDMCEDRQKPDPWNQMNTILGKPTGTILTNGPTILNRIPTDWQMPPPWPVPAPSDVRIHCDWRSPRWSPGRAATGASGDGNGLLIHVGNDSIGDTLTPSDTQIWHV